MLTPLHPESESVFLIHCVIVIIKILRDIFIILLLQLSTDLVNNIICIYINGSGFVGEHSFKVFSGTLRL